MVGREIILEILSFQNSSLCDNRPTNPHDPTEGWRGLSSASIYRTLMLHKAKEMLDAC